MIAARRVRIVAVLGAAALLAAIAEVTPAVVSQAGTPSATAEPAAAAARVQPAASASVLPILSATPPTPKSHLTGRIFRNRILVAYYGSPYTPSMGVLGETGPRRMTERLRKAARPFARGGDKVQIVYELIATVADAHPGPDGDYSHFIPMRYVRQYVAAARRNHALLVLDLQPGRATFMSQARRFGWALSKPWVGLAIDPEWRMRPGQVPAQTVGSVSAHEVNVVSGWLARVVRRHDLPQKLFMVHQFRTDMVHNIGRVAKRRGLAMVQHVDGFGTQGQKLATYHNVARPKQFRMGFKLFYDEDINRFSARELLRIRPEVKFVSFQ